LLTEQPTGRLATHPSVGKLTTTSRAAHYLGNVRDVIYTSPSEMIYSLYSVCNVECSVHYNIQRDWRSRRIDACIIYWISSSFCTLC